MILDKDTIALGCCLYSFFFSLDKIIYQNLLRSIKLGILLFVRPIADG